MVAGIAGSWQLAPYLPIANYQLPYPKFMVPRVLLLVSWSTKFILLDGLPKFMDQLINYLSNSPGARRAATGLAPRAAGL